jgi:biopolymer transport protein ExbD
MARAKLPRKSTAVDMTAMCDVAFLLLAFFILATKFKPPEALSVNTPSSVSTKIAPDKDVVMVTIDKAGKVYFSISESNRTEEGEILDAINTAKNLGITDAEKKAFMNIPNAYIGVPFSQLKSFLTKTPEELKHVALAGIPVLDSNNNEMNDWFRATKEAFQGKQMNVLVKGDDASKYPSFGGVIDALKKNDIMKFQIVTNPVAVPIGTDLYKTNMATGKKGAAD